MFGFLGMFWPANGKIERLMKSKISPFLIMGVEVFIFEELRLNKIYLQGNGLY